MRRCVLATVAVCAALQVPVPGSAFQVPVPVPGSVRALVSRGDRVYKIPIARREEGLSIGNGRTAAVVWTTASALKFQIDRVATQTINRFVDVELAGTGGHVFTAAGTHHRLSIFEGLLDVKAAGVNARIVAWPEQDVIAIEVEDRRPVPQPIQIIMRTQGSDTVHARGGRIVIVANVQEGTHRTKSAVTIALLGRRTFTQVTSDTEARIVSPAERGRVVILIATAVTLGSGQDPASMAITHLDAAADKSFDDLAGDTAEWWHEFWQHNAIGSADGNANKAADDHHYDLYLTRATGSIMGSAK